MDLDSYFFLVEKKIQDIFSRPTKNLVQKDIFFLEEERIFLEKSLALKQYQMKYGEVWQIVLGNYFKFQNLGSGHPSGLDILSTERKLILELKNSWNTDNASSRNFNFQKLINFKKQNPEYTIIYGVINDKTVEGQRRTILFKGNQIMYLSGQHLFSFLLGENSTYIIDRVVEIVKAKKKSLCLF